MEDAWLASGLEGYKVWKFALKRLPGQLALTTGAEEEAAAKLAVAEEGEEDDEEGEEEGEGSGE